METCDVEPFGLVLSCSTLLCPILQEELGLEIPQHEIRARKGNSDNYDQDRWREVVNTKISGLARREGRKDPKSAGVATILGPPN